MHGSAIAIAVILLVLQSSLPLAQAPLSSRPLAPIGKEGTGFFVFERISQSHFALLVQLIAMSGRVPIGFEEVASDPEPFDGDLSKIPVEHRTALAGLTVGAALDALIAVDRRYTWREQGGVLLVRPVKSWNEPGHFLNRRFDSFEAVRVRPADIATALYMRLRVDTRGGANGSVAARPADVVLGDRSVSVSISSGTVLDILNATVLSDGQLGWRVSYERRPADPQNSCIRFTTFDGDFSEIQAGACNPYY